MVDLTVVHEPLDPRCDGQPNHEGRAPSRDIFDGDAATVSIHREPAEKQTQAPPEATLAIPVSPDKFLEDLLVQLGRDRQAVVVNRDDGAALISTQQDQDPAAARGMPGR